MRGRRERQTEERREVMGTKNADDKVRCAGFPQRGNHNYYGEWCIATQGKVS